MDCFIIASFPPSSVGASPFVARPRSVLHSFTARCRRERHNRKGPLSLTLSLLLTPLLPSIHNSLLPNIHPLTLFFTHKMNQERPPPPPPPPPTGSTPPSQSPPPRATRATSSSSSSFRAPSFSTALLLNDGGRRGFVIDRYGLPVAIPGPDYVPPAGPRPSCIACMGSKVKCDRSLPVRTPNYACLSAPLSSFSILTPLPPPLPPPFPPSPLHHPPPCSLLVRPAPSSAQGRSINCDK